MRAQALPLDRIVGVETGGCPHTAIREDASINLAADRRAARALPRPRPDPDRERRRQPRGDLQPGARRPHDLRDRRRGRRQDPAQGRPRRSPARTCWSSTRPTSPPHVGASLEVMDRDARADARRAAVPVRPGPRRGRACPRSSPSSRPPAASPPEAMSHARRRHAAGTCAAAGCGDGGRGRGTGENRCTTRRRPARTATSSTAPKRNTSGCATRRASGKGRPRACSRAPASRPACAASTSAAAPAR